MAWRELGAGWGFKQGPLGFRGAFWFVVFRPCFDQAACHLLLAAWLPAPWHLALVLVVPFAITAAGFMHGHAGSQLAVEGCWEGLG